MAKNSKIDLLLSSLNKKLGGDTGRAILQKGSSIQWLSAIRFPTGSVGLDVITNGGLPRGAVTQYIGEESAAKSTMALKCCAKIQALYGEETAIGWIAVEAFDKQWANMVGLKIAFTPDELKTMHKKDFARYKSVKDVGQFVLASAISGEDSLQIAEEMIRSGAFHLVVVDSIAALSPMAELDKQMDEHTMTQLPRLVGKFLRKCYSAFNTNLEGGQRNQTAVLLINQVRDVIGGYGHQEPKPPGGWALKHAAHLTVRFRKGEVYKRDDSEKQPYGRRTTIKIEKSKVGKPLGTAEFDFYFDEYKGFSPGDIDTVQELRIWGDRAGLIQRPTNTAWVFNGQKFNGKGALDVYLHAHRAIAENLRRDILKVLTSGESE